MSLAFHTWYYKGLQKVWALVKANDLPGKILPVKRNLATLTFKLLCFDVWLYEVYSPLPGCYRESTVTYVGQVYYTVFYWHSYMCWVGMRELHPK